MTDPHQRQQQYGHPSTWPQQVPAPQPYAPAEPQEYEPPRTPPSRRRSRTGVWVGVAVAAIVVLAGGAVLASAAMGKGPAASVFKDSGVAACEQLRDNAAYNKAHPSTTSGPTRPGNDFQAYQKARKQFADSRYDDLRAAGVQVVDLAYQLGSSDKNSDASAGLALAGVGEFVKAYSALAGACAAHGVQLPKLSD